MLTISLAKFCTMPMHHYASLETVQAPSDNYINKCVCSQNLVSPGVSCLQSKMGQMAGGCEDTCSEVLITTYSNLKHNIWSVCVNYIYILTYTYTPPPPPPLPWPA